MEGRRDAMPTTNERALQNCPAKLKDTPHEKWREQCDSPTNPPTNASHDSPTWQHLPSAALYSCTATACVVVAMWFYNLFLKVGGFSFAQWSKATMKQWCRPISINATWKESFIDSYDKDNPIKPHHRPRVRVAPPKKTLQHGLILALSLFGHNASAGANFQLQSEHISQPQLRQYRGLQGQLNTCKLSIGDLHAVQTRVKAANDIFHAAIGGDNHAFSSIVDTGCSHTCSNDDQDFIPGTLKKLDQPISLGGIAGDLLIEYSGMVHWETVDAFGNIMDFKTMAFYCLFAPRMFQIAVFSILLLRFGTLTSVLVYSRPTPSRV